MSTIFVDLRLRLSENRTIYVKAISIVHQQNEVHNGEIVVAMIDDEATVKRYLRKKGDIWLLPENPDFSPINGNRAQILGRVTAVVRRYAG